MLAANSSGGGECTVERQLFGMLERKRTSLGSHADSERSGVAHALCWFRRAALTIPADTVLLSLTCVVWAEQLAARFEEE